MFSLSNDKDGDSTPPLQDDTPPVEEESSNPENWPTGLK